MKLSDVTFLAIGEFAWGKGKTPQQALLHMKQNGGSQKRYQLFICHPDTQVNGIGSVAFPLDEEPLEIASNGSPIVVFRRADQCNRCESKCQQLHENEWLCRECVTALKQENTK